MRVPLFTLNLAGLAVLAVPVLLILQSINVEHPLPDWALGATFGLLGAAALAHVGASALLSCERRIDPAPAGALVMISGLLFIAALVWLFALARFAGLG